MLYSEYTHNNLGHHNNENLHASGEQSDLINKDHHKLNNFFLNGMGPASPTNHTHQSHIQIVSDHQMNGGIFRDELMQVEPIHDWNSLVNIGEVPLLQVGTINNTHNHNVHDDSYFTFDMKI